MATDCLRSMLASMSSLTFADYCQHRAEHAPAYIQGFALLDVGAEFTYQPLPNTLLASMLYCDIASNPGSVYNQKTSCCCPFHKKPSRTLY